MTSGIPQDSILGPLSINMHRVKSYTNSNVDCHSYTDDTLLLTDLDPWIYSVST